MKNALIGIITLGVLIGGIIGMIYLFSYFEEKLEKSDPCADWVSNEYILFQLHEISDPPCKAVDPFDVTGIAWIDGKKIEKQFRVAKIITRFTSMQTRIARGEKPLVCLHKSSINGQFALETANHDNFDAAITHLSQKIE